MQKILIGSRATKHWFPEFREPKLGISPQLSDIDYATREDFEKQKISEKIRIEYHKIPILWDYCKSEIAEPEILYTLKLSHSFWDIHWNKTTHDILFFQNKGIEFNDELCKLLIEYWTPIHGEKRINLNKKTEEFFADAVKREISHDELHKIVMYGDIPWYARLLKYPDKPLLDKEKFFSNSLKDQLELAREEITVLAIERFILTKKIENYTAAYNIALKLVVTQVTKGWFPYFIMKNLLQLYFPDENYFRSIRDTYKYLTNAKSASAL